MKSKFSSLIALTSFLFMTLTFHGFAKSNGGDDGKKTTITGEVIDMQCYTSSGAHGPDHKECGTGCIKGGAPIGLLDKDGNVTLLVKDEKSAGDFPKLVDYVSQNVKVSGTLYKRGGISSMVVTTVAEAK